MQPGFNTLNSLSSWTNPVTKIKDPLKRRWAEIVQVMDSHLSGVCPLHIYINRRPIESQQAYALDYRVNNHQPLTKDPFDRAIAGIIEVCTEANIEIKVPEIIKNTELDIKEKDAYYFCLNDLVRVRENDPNAVIVVLPKIRSIDEQNVSVTGVELSLVASKDIDKISKYAIRFIGGDSDQKKSDSEFYPYYYNIDKGQYTLEYPNEKGEYSSYPIILINTTTPPYTYISSNVVYEGKYVLRLPYLMGSAAWGDKFYGNETDLSIQETRYTYLKEIRAKEKCREIGSMPDPTGRYAHINADGKPCVRCKGLGYIKDDSPLSTYYVDYEALAAEGKTAPQAIIYAEPPQAALTNAQTRCDEYFNRMCESLGLIKQNNTNQSAVSKDFDYKEKLSVIYTILQDNIRVLKDVYRKCEELLNIGTEPTSDVYLVGEIGKSSVDELLTKLSEAKKNMSPPAVITDLIDSIYYKTINPEYAELVVDTAKVYDKLYIYGADEITTARANLGAAIGVKEVTIHNTVIDVIEDYLEENGLKDKETIIKYLDEYYSGLTPVSTELL